MSIENDGAFFRIVEEEFSAVELEDLVFEPATTEPVADPYTEEPLQFGREHLLEVFHEVLDLSMADRQENEWPELAARFGNAIIPSLDARPDEMMLIEGPQVFMDNNGPGAVIAGHKVAGKFAGLIPKKLFLVDYDDYEDDPTLTETGEIGLYVVLIDACIEMADERVPLLGNALVSLSNGRPELFKRQRL